MHLEGDVPASAARVERAVEHGRIVLPMRRHAGRTDGPAARLSSGRASAARRLLGSRVEAVRYVDGCAYRRRLNIAPRLSRKEAPTKISAAIAMRLARSAVTTCRSAAA